MKCRSSALHCKEASWAEEIWLGSLTYLPSSDCIVKYLKSCTSSVFTAAGTCGIKLLSECCNNNLWQGCVMWRRVKWVTLKLITLLWRVKQVLSCSYSSSSIIIHCHLSIFTFKYRKKEKIFGFATETVCLSVWLSVLWPSDRLSVWLFVCLTVCLSLCLSVFLSVCSTVCLSDCLSVSLFVCLTVCLPVRLTVCLSDCLIVLSDCLSVWLSAFLTV